MPSKLIRYASAEHAHPTNEVPERNVPRRARSSRSAAQERQPVARSRANAEAAAVDSSAAQKPASMRERKRTWWAGPLCLISILVIAALGLWAHRQVETYERFQEMREVVARQTFYDGIAVDGVSVSGMSMEQALEAFSWRDDQENASFEIYLTAGESRWRISSNEVSLHRNTETTLRQAYSIGRVGTLEERYNIITNMRQAGTSLSTQMWYDHTAIRNLTGAIAQSLSIEGRDAGVSGFDFNTRTFTFTSEMAGQTVDADALYNQVVGALDREEYGSSIEVSVIHVEPKVTRDQVASLYGKVAGFTTQTTSSANRNANISLATQAINGSVLQPGEILSFNEKTGQRTYAKGYREAGAIQNGRLIDEVGGGVCQVSTTLFNAMVRANLTIVTRNPHAWPVDYVQRGEDAMVNWPDKDLKMQNNTDSPIYIIGSYANRSLSFEIYGRNIDNGMVIDLESVTTKTIPPSETVYTRDSTLAQGTEKVIRQARTGYQVTTYKVFYQNGKEVSREQFYKSEYKMYGKQVNYNN